MNVKCVTAKKAEFQMVIYWAHYSLGAGASILISTLVRYIGGREPFEILPQSVGCRFMPGLSCEQRPFTKSIFFALNIVLL